MSRLPSLQFYPGDWLRDSIAGCSLGAQGLWLRIMFLMHDSPRYGYLCTATGSPVPPAHVASQCGLSPEQYEALLAELDSVSVPSRTAAGVIFSRRMVRDSRRRAQYRKSKVSSKKQTFHTNSTQVPHVSSSSSSSSKTNTTPPTPPQAGGKPETFFEWQRQTIGVFAGGKRRIFTERDLTNLQGARPEEVVEFLRRKGLEARVVVVQ